MKPGLKQGVMSAVILSALVVLLMTVDPRVRERMGDLVSHNSASTLSQRAMDLGGTLVTAARHQSIENSPLVIFAAVGAIRFLFMLKT